MIHLGIHADDGGMVGDNDLDEVIKEITAAFEIKDLGPIKYFLGVSIVHDHVSGTVLVHQSGFME